MACSGRVTVLDAIDDVFDVTAVGLDDCGRLAGTISGFHSNHAVVWDPRSR